MQLFLDLESGKLIVVVGGLRYSMACIDSKTIRAEPTLPEFDPTAAVTVDRDDFDAAEDVYRLDTVTHPYDPE
ncbi:hypothetical protein DU500_07640 [Haloplanus rubicundus]|uniref:Uncharacterized protein n=1 Tax=Haloplanus rubicundus TaxID=1547898 RepID=A0A345E291_9EURY|nr:hypothetical protein [Haloplanus rubicundus]AXG06313.1 hypothetical protein DU500_07640 [Haloplanus rubicundus]